MSLIVNRGFELDLRKRCQSFLPLSLLAFLTNLKSEWLKGGSDGSAVEYGWGVAPYKL
jgi:hypothetical protein